MNIGLIGKSISSNGINSVYKALLSTNKTSIYKALKLRHYHARLTNHLDGVISSAMGHRCIHGNLMTIVK
jgi:hypothetical protein